MNVQKSLVTPGYFSTLQVQLLAGRVLTDSDNTQTAKVVVVNEKFAKYFFGSPQQAIGHYFGWGGGNGTKLDTQIVGVVKDARHRTVRGDVDRTVFQPYLQDLGPEALTVYIRTTQ